MKITTILNPSDLATPYIDTKTTDVEIHMFKHDFLILRLSDKVTFHDPRDNSFKVLKDRYWPTDDQLKQIRDRES